MLMIKNLLITLILFSTLSIFSQEEKYIIKLSTKEFVPEVLTQQKVKKILSSKSLLNGEYYAIIQFNNIPSESEVNNLKQNGIELLQYIPNYAYFASIETKLNLSSLNYNNNIRSLITITSDLKIHPDLKNVEKEYTEFVITCFKNISNENILSELKKSIKGYNIVENDKLTNIIRIKMSITDIPAISLLPFVQYIEPYIAPEIENNTGTTLHSSNCINNNLSGGLKYDGTGVGVSIGDAGYFFPHLDFTGRNNGSGSAEHATHVAGIVGGTGNLNPLYRGHAPGCFLLSTDGYDDIATISSISNLYNGNNKIRITNHSLGEGTNTGYNSSARTADLEVAALPSLYNVFSAGNSGSGWFTITGGYKAAKNSIAVGCIDETDVIASFSSRGPSADGRIKPDICAKGFEVSSTIPYNSYGEMSGTSMASPSAAGCITQLVHSYRDLNNNNDPELALLKAIVLNTSQDLGNIGPDYTYGWGRINTLKAFEAIKNNKYLSSSVSNNLYNTHTISVPANVKELKVMVYWADPAASSGVTKALINDIDISLNYNSTNFQPWVLDKNNPSLSAIKGVDRDNNMEQITVSNPSQGNYNLTVFGYQIPQGPQKYWVTYEYLTEDIKVKYPMGGESFVPGETEIIRWDTYGNIGSFTIQYSKDNGLNWTVLSSNVSGTSRYYSWTVPNDITGQALIKISRNGINGQSVSKFSIINVPGNLQIVGRCENSFKISWNAVPGATLYEVFLLGNKYMESKGTTSNNYAYIYTSNDAIKWASVRAISEVDGIIGRRANAIQVSRTINNCVSPPIADFYATSTTNYCNGTVSFIDNSSSLGNTTWLWNFGDDKTSTLQNPTNTYSSSGRYTVTLITTNENGSDTIIKTNYILINLESTPPSAPQAIAANIATSTGFKANWLKTDDALNYNIDIAYDSLFTNFVNGYNNLLISSDTFKIVNSLQCNTKYFYRVRAYNSCGTSENSNIVSVSTYGVPAKAIVSIASNISNTSFYITWNKIFNSSEYILDISTDSLFTNYVNGYNNLIVIDTSLNIVNLSCSTKYYYRVITKNICGVGEYSDTVSVTTLGIPSINPIANPAGEISTLSFNAQWILVNNATGYYVDVAYDSLFTNFVDGYNNKSVSNVSYTNITGLSCGTTYYYRIRAKNICGASENSNIVSVTTLGIPVIASAVQASNILFNAFKTNWNSVPGATEYVLDIAYDSLFTNYLSGYNNLNLSNTTSKNITGLSCETNYYYRVKARNICGLSSYSNIISVKTLGVPDSTQINPASNILSTSFTANWNSIPNATGYYIDVAYDSLFTNYVSGYNNKFLNNVTYYNISGIPCETTFYYRIRTSNSCGSGVNSNISFVTTLGIPNKTTALEATNISTTGFYARWTGISNTTGYKIDIAYDSLFTNFVEGYNDLLLYNVTYQNIIGLNCDTEYFYRIRATNACGSGANSNIISVKTIGSPTQVLSKSATTITSLNFTAQWNTVSFATGYVIDVAEDSLFTNFVNGYENKNTTNNNIIVSGLLCNQTYFYRVRAKNICGYGLYSNVIKAETLGVPNAPIANSASGIKSNEFNAIWSSVLDSKGYYIDVAYDSLFTNFVSGFNNYKTTATSIKIPGLYCDTVYFYRVKAYNVCGLSNNSNTIKVKTLDIPNTPILNIVSNVSSTGFTVSWNNVANVSSYYLDIAFDSLFTNFVSNYNNYNIGNYTSRSISGVQCETKYFIRVRASNICGTTNNSNIETVTTLGLPLNTVANSAINITYSGFTARWNSATNITGYNIDIAYDSLFNNFVSGYNNYSLTSYSLNVTGLTCNTKYFYRVRTKNNCGASINSNIISVTTLGISNSTLAKNATNINTTQFTANWNSIANITGYKIDVAYDDAFTNFVGEYRDYSAYSSGINITGLLCNTRYYYRVRTYSNCGSSANSNTISVDIPGIPTTTIAKNASNITSSSFYANWNSISNASFYILDVAYDSLFTKFVNGYNGLNVSNVNYAFISNLDCDSIYFYRIRVGNACGISDFSNVIKVKTNKISDIITATSAINTNSSGFTARWNSVLYATSYSLDIAYDSLFTNFVAGFNNLNVPNATSYTVTGLNCNTNYYYRIKANSNCNNSNYSNIISVTTIGNPTIPTANQVTNISTSGFSVSWNSVFNATGYYLDLAYDSLFTNYVTGYNNYNLTATSKSISGLLCNTKYFYRVKANNNCGASSYSNIVSAITFTKPDSIIALNATAVYSNSFIARWQGVSTVSNYYLDVAYDSLFTNYVTGYNNLSLTSSTTSKSVSGLLCNTKYYYRLKGSNSCGYTNYSEIVLVTTMGVPNIAVAKPASNITSTGFSATWNSVLNITNYYLDIAYDSLFTNYVTGYNNLSLTSSTTSRSVSGLNCNTKYYYRIRTKNSCGESENSNIIELTTLNCECRTCPDFDFNITTSSDWQTHSSEHLLTGCKIYKLPVLSGYKYYFKTGCDDGASASYDTYLTLNNNSCSSISTNDDGCEYGKSKIEWTATYSGDAFLKVSGYSNSSGNYTLAYKYDSCVKQLPVAINATNITQSGFTANWNNIINNTGYYLDIAYDSLFTNFLSGYNNLSLSNTVTSRNVTGLICNTNYYYRIRVKNICGISENSNIIKVYIGLNGAPIVNATSDITSTSAKANWTLLNGATGYYLDVASDSLFTNYINGYNNLSLSNVSSRMITGLLCNTEYFYRLRAKNSCQTTENSSIVKFKTIGSPDIVSTNAATIITNNSFTANWAQNYGATSYYLDIAYDSSFYNYVNGYKQKVISYSVISQNLTGLLCNTDYYYRLKAINSCGISDYSDTIKVTTKGIPNIVVAKDAINVSSASFTASWNAVETATTYYIDIAFDSLFTNYLGNYRNYSANNYTTINVSGLFCNLNYYYRIKASNSCGTSDYSNIISVKTSGTIIPTTAYNASSINSNGFTANWGSINGVTSYKIDVAYDSLFTNYVVGYKDKTTSYNYTSITGLECDSVYFYRIRTVNACGISSNSNTIKVFIPCQSKNCPQYNFSLIPDDDWQTHASSILSGGYKTYEMPVIAGNTYYFKTGCGDNALANFNTTLSLYNESCSLLTSNDDGCESSKSIIIWEANYSGYVHLKVAGKSSSDYGSYKLAYKKSTCLIPEIPFSYSATNITNTNYTCNWSFVPNAINYYLDIAYDSLFNNKVSGYNNLNVSNVNTYNISGLTCNTNHYYRIKASNICGESNYSKTVSVKTKSDVNLVGTNYPTSITENSFTVSWGSVSGAISYYLDIAYDSYFTNFVSGYNNLNVSNVTTYNVIGLNCNTRYYYRVRVKTNCGISENSSSYNVITLGTPIIASINQASNISTNSFLASWNSSTGAKNYYIDVAYDPSFLNFVSGYTNLNVSNITSYNINGLNCNTNYYYRVRAGNSCGISDNSSTITVLTLGMPSTTTAKLATNISTLSFTANWNSVTNTIGYYLDVAYDSIFSSFVTGYNNLNVLNVTSKNITGLLCDTTYYYRVRGSNNCGSSSNSNIVSVSLLGSPNSVTSNPALNITGSTFRATWNSVTNATGYYLDVAYDSLFTNFVSGYNNLNVNNVTYKDVTGLLCDTTYFYRIRAFNSCRTSKNSNIISIITNGKPNSTILNNPTNLTISSFTVSWNSVPNTTGYYLDIAYDSLFTNFVSGYNNLSVNNVTSKSISGLTCNTDYYVRVKPSNSCGYGNFSNIVFTKTIGAPEIVNVKQATNITNNSFTANWNTAIGANNYYLDIAYDSLFTSFVSGYNNLSLTSSTLSRSVTGLVCNKKYYYRLRSNNNCGTSQNSNIISLSTYGIPEIPQNLTATTITANSFIVNWTQVSGASNYYIDIATDSLFTSFVSGNNNRSLGNVASITITGLFCNTAYYTRIRAYNSCGFGLNSDTIKITTSECICRTCPDFDFEILPNDNWQSHSSTLVSGGCRIYKIQVVANKFYQFKTGCGDGANANFDTYLELYRGCNLVKSNDDGCDSLRSSIEWKSDYNEVIYVKIKGYNNSTGDYSLAYKQFSCIKPLPPVAIIASGINQTSFTANWNTVSDITGYLIDVSSDSLFTTYISGYKNKLISYYGSYSTNVSQLTCNNAYYYRLRTFNNCDTSNFSNIIKVNTSNCICLTCPEHDFTINPNNSWQLHASSHIYQGCKTYKIYLEKDSTYIFKTGCEDGANSNYQTYLELFDSACVLVKSDYNGCGNGGSIIVYKSIYNGFAYLKVKGYDDSYWGNFILAYKKTPCYTPLSPIASNCSNISYNSFKVSWNSVVENSNYYLDIATDPSFTNFVSGYNNTDVSNVTTYSVSGLTCNTNYYYRVRSSNSCGTSNNSNIISCITTSTQFIPYFYAATNINYNGFTLNWAVNATVINFYLDIATDPSFTNFVSGYNNRDVSNITTYNVTDLSSSTTYYCRIKANYGTCGTSNYSSTYSVSTSAAPQVCLVCPNYDFSISADNYWKTHSSSISSNNCKIYKIYVVNGSNYSFKTGCYDGATANFDTYLTLFNNNCNQITQDDDGCESNRSLISWTSTYSGYVYLKINGYGSASGNYSLSYQSNSSQCNVPTPIISLIDDVLYSNAPNGNQWYNQNGPISNATNQTYVVVQNGSYYVIATIDNCSSDTSNYINISNLDDKLIEKNNTLIIYPNPFENYLTVELKDNSEPIYYEINNSIGQIVNSGSFTEKIIIKTDAFVSGVYIIKLKRDNSFEYYRIVKDY